MKRVVLTACAVLLVILVTPLPEPVELPPLGMNVLDRDGRVLYQAIDPQRGAARPVALEAVATSLRDATIAVEDASFDVNPGVDLLATGRALAQNIRAGHVVAGGSTITQQLARLRYLSEEQRQQQSVLRKLHEAWLAVRLTVQVGKHVVLEQYLNSAPYGNLAIGAEAAAWTYFGKPARELSVAESALLAGLPQSPTDYDPFLHAQAARERQRVVLGLMVRHGMLSEAQAESASREALQFNDRPFPLDAAHFVDYVRASAPSGATSVRTTLDRDVQSLAERAAQRQVAMLRDHDVGDAAVVVLDPRSGEVLAMVGGVNYFDTEQTGAQVNMAVSRRQPGSAFKPITYAAALESGLLSEASILNDERTVFHTRTGEAYVPENYDHQFHGPVPMRVALASSLNIPAVRVLSEVGVDAAASLANDMGLGLGDARQYDLSLTLGGAEVRLLDLVAAYAAFANGGVYHTPVVIAGTASPPQRVVSPETAWLISDMLSDDAARGTGFGRGSVLSVGARPVAVKTGTTSDYRDNWTIGYTPDVVVGVWVGNPDNHAMRDVSGVTGAAPLWRDVFDQVVASTPVVPFERPQTLVQRELCAEGTEAVTPACPAHRLEWLPRDRPLASDAHALDSPRITYPDPGATFGLDPRLPAIAQRLPVQVETLGPTDVFVDEECVGHLEGSGVVGWAPTPGKHTLRVVGPSGVQTVGIQVVPSSGRSDTLP